MSLIRRLYGSRAMSASSPDSGIESIRLGKESSSIRTDLSIGFQMSLPFNPIEILNSLGGRCYSCMQTFKFNYLAPFTPIEQVILICFLHILISLRH